MIITKLRKANGLSLTDKEQARLIERLQNALKRKGYITNVCAPETNPRAIKLSCHMKSFTIDTDKLGHNARVNSWTVKRTKLGYKRTNIPTWEQREDYNHTINDVLDRYGYSANIKSGEYVVRDSNRGRVNHWDKPEPQYNSYLGCYIAASVIEVVQIEHVQEHMDWLGLKKPETDNKVYNMVRE